MLNETILFTFPFAPTEPYLDLNVISVHRWATSYSCVLVKFMEVFFLHRAITDISCISIFINLFLSPLVSYAEFNANFIVHSSFFDIVSYMTQQL